MSVTAESADVRFPLCTDDDAVRGQFAQVSEMARRAAQVASLLGPSVSFEHVAAMLDVSPTSLLGPLEELVRAELLSDDGASLRFRDDLLRKTVVETLPGSALPALQRQAIEVLLAAGASPVEPATGLADNARTGDRSAISTLLAVSRSLGPCDPAAGAALCRRAFDLTVVEDELRTSVAAETALLLQAADCAEEGKALVDGALRERPAPAAEGAIRLSVARMPALSPEVRVEMGRTALDLPGVIGVLRTRHLSQLVANLLETGLLDEAQDLLPEATSAVDAADDPSARVALDLAKSRIAYMGGAFHDALQHVESLDLGQPGDGDHGLDEASQWRAEVLCALDRFDAAHEAAADGVAAARRGRQAWAERSWRQLKGRCLLQAGRISDAAAALDGAVRADDAPAVTNVADAAALAARGRIAIHAGDARTARSLANHAEQALQHGALEVRRHVASFLVLHALAGGESGSARRRLAKFRGEHGVSVLPLLMLDTTDPVVLVRIALAAGDDGLAESAISAAQRRLDLTPDVSSLAATAAHARGLWTRDPSMLAEATSAFRGGNRPLPRASAHEDHGVALVRHGDRTGGVAELHEALRIYSNAGATWDAARVRRRLRDFGVRPRLVKAARPASGWAALTHSEVAVARLVAEGLKNREAAERLFVSRHTVSMHLRNAFTKLDINSRVELARLVFEHEEEEAA